MTYLQTAKVGFVRVPKPQPTEEEGQRALPAAVQVILFTACLHSALYDLQVEMGNIGQYRHNKKRWLNEATDQIGYIHQSLHKGIGSYSAEFGDWYNKQMEIAENKIKECIWVEAPNRAYSIAMALFRMTAKANDKCGRYRSPLVDKRLAIAKTLINRCDFPVEDKHIDFILETQIDTEHFTRKIEDKL